jgi:hypothetical protein
LAPNVPAFGADIRGFNGDELHGSGISKPPPDVGERRGSLRTSCFHAERPEQWPTRPKRDLANFGKMD